MKTLCYRPVILALALLFCAPNPGRAAGSDTETLLDETHSRAQQAMETATALAEEAVQKIHATVRELKEETDNSSIRMAPRENKVTLPAGKNAPADADRYDSELAQKKAEAALRRTGPTGPHLVGIVASSSDLVVLSDDLVAPKKPVLGRDTDLQAKAVGLDRAISDLDAKITGTAIIVNLQSDVLFDFDRATIKPAAEEVLAKVALIIRKKGTGRVLIEGHTDAKGSQAYNQKLSERRALAVRNWLVQHGTIAPEKMVTRGYGETRPVAANTLPDGSDNPEGRARNRRVEITISTRQAAD